MKKVIFALAFLLLAGALTLAGGKGEAAAVGQTLTPNPSPRG